MEESKRHGFEELVYDSDEVQVVMDSFAGSTEVPDYLNAADVEPVAGHGCSTMETVEQSERHGFEELIYDSDEVQVVMDSFAGNTEVPDSLDVADLEPVAVAAEAGDAGALVLLQPDAVEVDAADALVLLFKTPVNTFQADKDARFVANLMVPLLVPCLYKEKDQEVRDAATDLHWISHSYVRGCGLDDV